MSAAKCLIYASQISSRLQYITNFLFNDILGLDILILTNINDFKQSSLPKINYSKCSVCEKELFIQAGDLLFQQHIQYQIIENELKQAINYKKNQLFNNAKLTVDIFSLSFFLLSRYEEYLPFKSDQHHRFPSSESIANKFNFLDRPIIDEWALELGSLLQKTFPTLKLKPSGYKFQPTYDIDIAWAFGQRNWWRTIGGYFQDLKQLDNKRLLHRIQVHRGKTTDPFDQYDYLYQLHKNQNYITPIYFFLLGKYGTFDKNINSHNKHFQTLIQKIDSYAQVGIHPSYSSNQSASILHNEQRQLERIIGTQINRSRQHYLKLTFPRTYQQLCAIGINNDYTMGYADAIGFRASTARSFLWYDLSNDKLTNLRIHPFMVMDVSLRYYLKLSTENAITRTHKLINCCKQVGGTFCSIWHNSSFSEIDEWTDWKKVYERIFHLAIAPTTE